jgi:hypothetical protein
MATIFWVIYPSADPNPTAFEIAAQATVGHFYGEDEAPVVNGVFVGDAIEGMRGGASYKLASVWWDGWQNYSPVVYTSAFYTPAVAFGGTIVVSPIMKGYVEF